MWQVFEVNQPMVGVRLVCDVGPDAGGTPVRLMSTAIGAELVRFVPAGPDVVAVHVVEGGPSAAERARAVAAATPPSVDALSDEEHAILGDLTEKWNRVGRTGGTDPGVLLACAQAAVAALDHEWPETQWVENLLMMGGRSAVTLWTTHGDATSAATVLPALADHVTARSWLQGGPSGMFPADEAHRIVLARAEVQRSCARAAAARSPGPGAGPEPAPDGEPRGRWPFDGR